MVPLPPLRPKETSRPLTMATTTPALSPSLASPSQMSAEPSSYAPSAVIMPSESPSLVSETKDEEEEPVGSPTKENENGPVGGEIVLGQVDEWQQDGSSVVQIPPLSGSTGGGEQASLPMVVDDVWVYGVTLKMNLVSRVGKALSPDDVKGFEQIVSKSCLTFYASFQDPAAATTTPDTGGTSHRHDRRRDVEMHYNMDGQRIHDQESQEEGEIGNSRHGSIHNSRHLKRNQPTASRRRNARDVIQADITFVRQTLSYDENDMSVNIITYDQHFVFDPTKGPGNENSDSANNNNNNNGDDDPDGLGEEKVLFTPIKLSKIPFNETEWNMRLGNDLKAAVPSLKDVKLPLEVPHVPDQAQFQLAQGGGGGGEGSNSHLHVAKKGQLELSESAVAGLFMAVAILFAGGAVYALWCLEQAITKKVTRSR